MIIIHKIDDLAFELFPELKGKNIGNKDIIKVLKDFYTYGPFVPKIEIQSGFVKIDINTEAIDSQEEDYQTSIKYCEAGKFTQAIQLLKELIKRNPTNSEFHRVLGQSYSSIGKQDEAIDCLIDALKWDPNNNYALLMIGNIFAKFKNDLDTAKKYYDRAIENNPNDHIAINNLGTNFLMAGKIAEGLDYLEKAYSANDKYTNTIYGIALANEMLGNTLIAFEFGVECLKKCKTQDSEIKKHCIDLIFNTAKEYLKNFSGEKLFLEYKSYVEKLCKRPIKVVVDDDLTTSAHLEYAENHERDYHLIKYKSDRIGVYHLMMHELAHLQLATEAREVNENMQYITSANSKKKFKSDFSKNIEVLRKSKISESSIEEFFNSLFNGINNQLFNTPVDMFIEDRLFDMYNELRPIQFLSIFQMLEESAQGYKNKNIVSFTPAIILSANKILNLVMAFQFKDLFGFDIADEFYLSKAESKLANDFYQEFNDYRNDKEPGEEYELIQHWGEDLHLAEYFTLRKEPSFDKPWTVEQAIEHLENDPFSLDSDKEFKDDQMKTFQESQKDIGTNMAVVMFMVDALEYFKPLPKSKIKDIAFQIAMIGTQGISPDKNGYKVPEIKNKEFSGYHLLAYYYVSWKLAIPEMLSQLHLPYDNEFKLASQLFKPKQ